MLGLRTPMTTVLHLGYSPVNAAPIPSREDMETYGDMPNQFMPRRPCQPRVRSCPEPTQAETLSPSSTKIQLMQFHEVLTINIEGLNDVSLGSLFDLFYFKTH